MPPCQLALIGAVFIFSLLGFRPQSFASGEINICKFFDRNRSLKEKISAYVHVYRNFPVQRGNSPIAYQKSFSYQIKIEASFNQSFRQIYRICFFIMDPLHWVLYITPSLRNFLFIKHLLWYKFSSTCNKKIFVCHLSIEFDVLRISGTSHNWSRFPRSRWVLLILKYTIFSITNKYDYKVDNTCIIVLYK